MRGLLGDRFLRRFTDDLKQRRKHPNSTGEGQNPEAEVDAALGPEAAGSDVHTSVEDLEESGADPAVVDDKPVPIKPEPARQNEIGPKAD